MKTMKLLLVKPLLQESLNRCFFPKHLGRSYDSSIYYHFHARRNFPVIQLECLSLTTSSNHFNSLCGDLHEYPITLNIISLQLVRFLAGFQSQIFCIVFVQVARVVSK